MSGSLQHATYWESARLPGDIEVQCKKSDDKQSKDRFGQLSTLSVITTRCWIVRGDYPRLQEKWDIIL